MTGLQFTLLAVITTIIGTDEPASIIWFYMTVFLVVTGVFSFIIGLLQ